MAPDKEYHEDEQSSEMKGKSLACVRLRFRDVAHPYLRNLPHAAPAEIQTDLLKYLRTHRHFTAFHYG